jgi:hypothetical protein
VCTFEFNNPYYTELDEAQAMDGCGFAGFAYISKMPIHQFSNVSPHR